MSDLQGESTRVLQRLIRFNTVNPPGNERAAIEYLKAYVEAAGFDAELLGVEAERPNLVATLTGAGDGPTLVLLGHVDTVLADARDWRHDPWGGDLADGCVWGRGALDMKSQVAAEAVAAVSLARERWRPARGALKLVFVADEEASGTAGARWLTEHRADKVRCDLLLNEGDGSPFDHNGIRYYGVCCGEKGVFRMQLTAHGAAGHASIPALGDNALLKLVPALAALRHGIGGYDPTEVPLAMIAALGEDPADPAGAVRRLCAQTPLMRVLLEPQLAVTMTPTMIRASEKMNVIPARASVKVDTRVPPGLGAEVALARMRELLGDAADSVEIEFTEQVYGYASPARSPLMDAIDHWVSEQLPGARTVPTLLSGYSDSSYFRAAFPDLVAYGFFPHRHQTVAQTAPLVHNADERIDVGDLEFATRFYRDVAVKLLG